MALISVSSISDFMQNYYNVMPFFTEVENYIMVKINHIAINCYKVIT